MTGTPEARHEPERSGEPRVCPELSDPWRWRFDLAGRALASPLCGDWSGNRLETGSWATRWLNEQDAQVDAQCRMNRSLGFHLRGRGLPRRQLITRAIPGIHQPARRRIVPRNEQDRRRSSPTVGGNCLLEFFGFSPFGSTAANASAKLGLSVRRKSDSRH